MKKYYEPDEVWEMYLEYFLKYKDGDKVLLAENTDTGVEIYLLFDMDPAIVVIMDNCEPIYETVETEEECLEVVKDVYDYWLSNDVIKDCISEAIDEQDEQLEIEFREQELDSLITGFVAEVTMDENDWLDADITEDLKEHFLMYMYKKHGLEPYRPMYIKDGNGKLYSEFPYEYLSG